MHDRRSVCDGQSICKVPTSVQRDGMRGMMSRFARQDETSVLDSKTKIANISL